MVFLLGLGYFFTRPTTGVVHIESDPEGAVVKINGQKHYTPFDLELAPGDYPIKVHKQRYKLYQEVITVTAGETLRLVTRLESAAGSLNLTTKPEGAKLVLSGADKSKTPVQLEGLPPQTYSVKVVKDGYKPYEGEVEVIAGKTRNLAVNLTKIPPPKPVYRPPTRSYRPSSSQPSYRPPPRQSSRPRSRPPVRVNVNRRSIGVGPAEIRF